MFDHCHVSGDNCLAPAGHGIKGMGFAHGDKAAKAICFQCGEPVCSACSRRVRTIVKGKRVRVCEYCQEEA